MKRSPRLPVRPRLLGDAYERLRTFGSAPVAMLLFATLVVACGGGGNPPQSGGPQAAINSPLAGSMTAGTFFFSVQPLDPAAVARVDFRAGGASLGSDADGSDGFRVFVSAPEHPAGTLTLEAVVTGTDGRATTLTRTVTNVPQPPSATTVGSSGAALGTEEADGSLSTLIVPPGSAAGASVEFTAMTQAEVKTATGVDYDALGITFLGAQDITTNQEFDRTLGLSSGGFGPAVQASHSVVNYLIGPDEDGDGVGEVYVVNTASVAPNGDVISDPVPIAHVGQSATLSSAGEGRLAPLATGLSAPPGARLEVPVAGFNASSIYGNVAEFRVGGTTIERFGRILTSEAGAQTFVVHVPPFKPGTGTLTLRNLGSGYASDAISLTVQPRLAAPGSAAQRIEDTLTLFEDTLVAIDAVLAGTGRDIGASLGQPFFDLIRSNVAVIAGGGTAEDAAALDSLASRIVASGLDELLNGILDDLASSGGIRAAQQGGCNDILDRADKGINAINELTDLGDYSPGGSDALGKMHSYAFDSWWTWVKNTTRTIDKQMGGSACPEVPPAPPGPGTRATPSGMGAAVPWGGNVGGSASPPNIRPIPDYARGVASMALEQARGRFLVTIAVAGSPVPFKSTTDAGGYFMIPMVPVGEPFTAVAIDTVTGENRVASGVGPAVGEGYWLAFDFGTGESEYVDVRWDGEAGDGQWLTATNWDTNTLPQPNANVIIPAGSGAVTLNNYSGDASKVLVNSVSVETGSSLSLIQGTLELIADSVVAGELRLANGDIRPQGDLLVTGTATWLSGQITGDGTLVNRGTLTIDTDQTTNARDLFTRIVNHSNAVVKGTKAAALRLGEFGAIENAVDGTFEVQGVTGVIRIGSTSGAFDNLGTLVKSGAGLSEWKGPEVNHLGGTVNVLEGTLHLMEGSTSTGATWTVSAGAVLALGWQTREIDLVGTYSGDGPGVVRLAGGTHFAIGAAGATFDFPIGGVEWTGAAITGPGVLRNDGLFSIVTTTAGALTGHLDNRGTMRLGGTGTEMKNSGGAIIDNASGARFEVLGDQGIASANDPLTFRNAGTLEKVGGTGTSTFKACHENMGGTIIGDIVFNEPAACGG